MNITKEQVREWLLKASDVSEEGDFEWLLALIHDCIQDLTPKWVSTMDSLPKPCIAKVLVSSVIFGKMVTTGIYTPEYGEACFECDVSEDEMGQEPELHHIDHWMPLPDPPK